MPEPAATFDDVRAAADRISPYAHRTPVATSATLARETGADVFFKCENLQKVGAFKARGALNAVLSLEEEAAQRGVITHSSGNHGAALAYAASIRGIPCTVVMPEPCPSREDRCRTRVRGQHRDVRSHRKGNHHVADHAPDGSDARPPVQRCRSDRRTGNVGPRVDRRHWGSRHHHHTCGWWGSHVRNFHHYASSAPFSTNHRCRAICS